MKVTIDFTEDLMFKVLLLGTSEYQNKKILIDFVVSFAGFFGLKIKEEDVIIPKTLPYVDCKKVLKILKNKKLTPREVEEQLQKMIPDITVHIKRADGKLDEFTIEMQKRTPKFLLDRMCRQLATTITHTKNDPKDFSKTGYALNLWLLPKQQIQQYLNEPVVETLICTRVKKGSRYVYKPAYDYAKSVSIAINDKKLIENRHYKKNDRLKLWINFLSTGELNLEDEIQKSIYELYVILKKDKEWYEMAKAQPTNADYLVAEGIEQGIEKGIEKGIEIGIVKGREEGREEGRNEEKIQNAKNALANNVDVELVATITGLPLYIVEELKKSL